LFTEVEVILFVKYISRSDVEREVRTEFCFAFVFSKGS
jgi:hypothetical protein